LIKQRLHHRAAKPEEEAKIRTELNRITDQLNRPLTKSVASDSV